MLQPSNEYFEDREENTSLLDKISMKVSGWDQLQGFHK